MNVKAIETAYRGYRFRSRLEARWAIFFDALGIPWEYEKEGYELPSGRYLPDFWLPQHECWIEIKPCAPDERAQQLMRELVEGTRQPGYIATSSISFHKGTCWGVEHLAFWPECEDCCYVWCECTSCGAFGLEFEARSDRLPCKECVTCSEYNEAKKRLRPDSCCSTLLILNNYDIHLAECPKNGQGCPRQYGGNLDRGHTGDSHRLLKAYAAARSARFEFGETPCPR